MAQTGFHEITAADVDEMERIARQPWHAAYRPLRRTVTVAITAIKMGTVVAGYETAIRNPRKPIAIVIDAVIGAYGLWVVSGCFRASPVALYWIGIISPRSFQTVTGLTPTLLEVFNTETIVPTILHTSPGQWLRVDMQFSEQARDGGP